MEINDLVITAAFGGFTGFVGSFSGSVVVACNRRGQRKHDLKMRKIDLDEMSLEAANIEKQHARKTALPKNQQAHKTSLAKNRQAHEAKLTKLSAHVQSLEASFKKATTKLSTGDSRLPEVADFVRAMVRPICLFLLLGLTAFIFFHVDSESVKGVRKDIADAVIYLTSTAGAWYFNGRQLEKNA